jgi:hypothetical protein
LVRESRAFSRWLHPEWFGPLITGDRGFTSAIRFEGQHILVVLPLSTHEMPVRPTYHSRSFGPSAIVSGSAYLFLRLSASECLNSFADSLTYYALS